METIERVRQNVSKLSYFLTDLKILNSQEGDALKRAINETTELYKRKKAPTVEKIAESLRELVRIYADGKLELRDITNDKDRELLERLLSHIKWNGKLFDAEEIATFFDNEGIDAVIGLVNNIIEEYEDDKNEIYFRREEEKEEY